MCIFPVLDPGIPIFSIFGLLVCSFLIFSDLSDVLTILINTFTGK